MKSAKAITEEIERTLRDMWKRCDLEDSEATMSPMAHFVGEGDGEDEVVLVAGGFHSERAKDEFVEFCQRRSLERRSVAVALVCESWYVDRRADDVPSRCGDRKEGVFISLAAMDPEQSILVLIPILRDDDERRSLGEARVMSGGALLGRMTRLLHPLITQKYDN